MVKNYMDSYKKDILLWPIILEERKWNCGGTRSSNPWWRRENFESVTDRIDWKRENDYKTLLRLVSLRYLYTDCTSSITN